MDEFRTYVFKKSRRRARKHLLYNSSIFAAIGAIVLMYFWGILGIGFGLIGSISLIITLIQMKKHDDKYMGISTHGERGDKFFITESSLKIGDTLLPFSELSDLIIYVDEYTGMPKNLFGVHHGGNNEITFKHKGKPYSFNYIIKNKTDFLEVEKLVERIENKT
jgi:hypothetical protein